MNTLAEYMDYINAHREQVLGNLDQESIDAYVSISRRFETCDVSTDRNFQNDFRTFYQLNIAGLTEDFKTEYFRRLQGLRGMDPIDLRDLVLDFYFIPTRRGHNSLQFSFVTKLVHTLDASCPIYDREIAEAFAFSPPGNHKPVRQRLGMLIEFHERLKATYGEILDQGLLNPTVQDFRTIFHEQAPFIGNVKIIDFIFWSTGKLISKGVFADPPNRIFQ